MPRKKSGKAYSKAKVKTYRNTGGFKKAAKKAKSY